MTLSIISSAEDLTPEWFTELLRSSGDLDAEATVVAADVEPFGSYASFAARDLAKAPTSAGFADRSAPAYPFS